MFDTLFATIRDYTIDKRGDIGSKTRVESMYAIFDLLVLLGDCL